MPKPIEFIGQLEVKVTPEKVDAIDRKILYLLSLNARFSSSVMARHLKLSREVVAYRTKRMEEGGIIHGYLTLIDSQRLGKVSKTVLFKLHSPQKVNPFLEKLKTLPLVSSLTHCGGKYDVLLNILGNNEEECYTTFQEIIDRGETMVQDYSLTTKLEQHFLGLSLLMNDEKERTFLRKIQEKKGSSFQQSILQRKEKGIFSNTDATDIKILQLLHHNARMNLQEQADKTNIGIYQVQSRMKKLIENGIIQGFVPYISLAHLEFQFTLILLTVKKDQETKFRQWVKDHHSIVWMSKHLGQYNYKLSLFIKNNAHLSEVLQEMEQEFSSAISHVDVMPVFQKKQYRTLHPF